MTPELEERYKFCKLWDCDFYEALRVTSVFKANQEKSLRSILIDYIIITYCRPFSANRGVLKRNHRINEEVVPRACLALHREFVKFRDELIAHTDFSARDPKVVNWSNEKRKWFPMSLRGYGNEYLKLFERIDEIEKMIGSCKTVNLKEINDFENELIKESL